MPWPAHVALWQVVAVEHMCCKHTASRGICVCACARHLCVHAHVQSQHPGPLADASVHEAWLGCVGTPAPVVSGPDCCPVTAALGKVHSKQHMKQRICVCGCLCLSLRPVDLIFFWGAHLVLRAVAHNCQLKRTTAPARGVQQELSQHTCCTDEPWGSSSVQEFTLQQNTTPFLELP